MRGNRRHSCLLGATRADEAMPMLPEIEQRWSAPSFTSKSVDKETIARILEAGRQAPSAKNRQEWRFVVATKADLRRKLADAAFGQDQVATAPMIVAACTTNIDYRMPNGQLSYPVDLAVSVAFIMLQARHDGVDSCAVTTFNELEVKDLLTVPHAMRVVALVALGYSAEEPPPRERKPLADIVGYEHW